MLGINMRFIYISFLVAHVLLGEDIDSASAESYEDKRCRCVCASPSAILNYTGKDATVNTGKDGNVNTDKDGNVNTDKDGNVNTDKDGNVNTDKDGNVNTDKDGNVNKGKDHNVFTGNISPSMCSCEDWVLTMVDIEVKGQERVFCLRCECKYETRNTTMIMAVVFIVISVIMCLSVYMTFLVCLHPMTLLHKVRPYRNQRHHRPAERRRLLLVADGDVEDEY